MNLIEIGVWGRWTYRVYSNAEGLCYGTLSEGDTVVYTSEEASHWDTMVMLRTARQRLGKAS